MKLIRYIYDIEIFEVEDADVPLVSEVEISENEAKQIMFFILEDKNKDTSEEMIKSVFFNTPIWEHPLKGKLLTQVLEFIGIKKEKQDYAYLFHIYGDYEELRANEKMN